MARPENVVNTSYSFYLLSNDYESPFKHTAKGTCVVCGMQFHNARKALKVTGAITKGYYCSSECFDVRWEGHQAVYRGDLPFKSPFMGEMQHADCDRFSSAAEHGDGEGDQE